MEWIDVTERLPKDGENVFVLTYRGAIRISSIQYQNVTCADQKIIKIKKWWRENNEQVTHWLSMPKIPKEILKKIEKAWENP